MGLQAPSFYSWLGRSGHQSHHIRTKDTAVTREIAGDLGALSGVGVKDQVLEQKLPPVFLSRRKLQGFRSSVQEPGTETNMSTFLLSQNKILLQDCYPLRWDLPTLSHAGLSLLRDASRCGQQEAHLSGFYNMSQFLFCAYGRSGTWQLLVGVRMLSIIKAHVSEVLWAFLADGKEGKETG